MGRIDADGYWVEGRHKWKVPYGVRQAFKERLTFSMIASKYPFYVTWVSPKTRKRLRKNFMSLGSACQFICVRAQYADPNAAVVVKLGFYIPRNLMGKFPRQMGEPARTHYWCPRCMQPRRFRRTGQNFVGARKFPETDKYGNPSGYEWRDVPLALLRCEVCAITNRDHKFRPSNQPLEKRVFKQGVTRARRRRAS